jgi:hypothetical protein
MILIFGSISVNADVKIAIEVCNSLVFEVQQSILKHLDMSPVVYFHINAVRMLRICLLLRRLRYSGNFGERHT